MIVATNEAWRLPDFFEPYREFVENTGGLPIEQLMGLREDTTLLKTNFTLWLCVRCVESQMALLLELEQQGLLATKRIVKKGRK
jgi:hypothetical protein